MERARPSPGSSSAATMDTDYTSSPRAAASYFRFLGRREQATPPRRLFSRSLFVDSSAGWLGGPIRDSRSRWGNGIGREGVWRHGWGERRQL